MATVRKNPTGPGWVVQYTQAFNRRRSKRRFREKRAAEAFAREKECELDRARGGLPVLISSQVRLVPLLDAYLEALGGRASEGHVAESGRILVRLLSDLSVAYLSDLTPAIMERRLAERVQTVAPRTANIELGRIKAMLAWALDGGQIQANPLARVKALRIHAEVRNRRELTLDETDRLLNAAASHPKCQRWERGLYALALCAGLRVREARLLEWRDVDSQAGQLHVRAECAKWHRETWLPLSTDLAAILTPLRHRAELRAGGGDIASLRVLEGCWEKPIRRYKRTLGYADVAFRTADGTADLHALRHTFCSRVGRTRPDLRTLLDLTRHRDPRVAARYLHADASAARRAIAALPPIPVIG